MCTVVLINRNKSSLEYCLNRLSLRGGNIVNIDDHIELLLRNFDIDNPLDIISVDKDLAQDILASLIQRIRINCSIHSNVILGVSQYYFLIDLIAEELGEISYVLFHEHPYLQVADRNISDECLYKIERDITEYFNFIVNLWSSSNAVLVDNDCVASKFETFKSALNNWYGLTLKSNWKVGDFQKMNIQQRDDQEVFLINLLLDYNPKLFEIYSELLSVSSPIFNPKVPENKDTDKSKALVIQLLNSKVLLKDEVVNKLQRQLKKSNKSVMQLEKKLSVLNAKVQIPGKEITKKPRNLIEYVKKENHEFIKLYKSIENKDSNHCSNKNNSAKHFGAGIRVKSTKEYLIGNSLIKIYNDPKRILKIHKVYKHIKKQTEQSNGDLNNLPSLEEYEDYYEVKRIKNHLSYKLGKVIVSTNKSNIHKLPFKLAKHSIIHKLKKYSG
ncbi:MULTISPECIES: hypothetical protein [unclassified Psychrobacter]|uniref:hypothetical protein n=1 Tax=unclassified Psychrobacter TaxID=196806 RepID=UPI0004119BA5|nr:MULTISPECIES: hypothetical protein [unclassified Psychrobacter]